MNNKCLEGGLKNFCLHRSSPVSKQVLGCNATFPDLVLMSVATHAFRLVWEQWSSVSANQVHLVTFVSETTSNYVQMIQILLNRFDGLH